MYRALIVEDEPPILRKITSSLRAVSDAFDIEVAHDGQEAFEYLMNTRWMSCSPTFACPSWTAWP